MESVDRTGQPSVSRHVEEDLGLLVVEELKSSLHAQTAAARLVRLLIYLRELSVVVLSQLFQSLLNV